MIMNMTMNFKTFSRLLLSVVLVFMFTFTTVIVFGAEDTAAAPGAAEQTVEKCPKTVKVLVEEIKGSMFLEFKDLEGEILPWKKDEFKSPIAGGIKKLEISVGSDVKAGDVVALIDDAPIKKEIALAKANISKWKRQLFRREHWKVRSERAELQAKRNIKKYTDLLAQKEEELKKNQVTSPVDGRIDVLKVNEGDFISKDFIMGTIVNIEKVRILLETYADKVTDGQKIKINIKELSKTVEGVVRKDAEGSTFIYIENSDKQILHGMTAQFRILFQEHKNAVVLPRGKILKDEAGHFVYVVNGKLARKAVLKIGPVENGRTLILKGLAIGDEMIVSEVLSAKQGTLKEKMICVSHDKKIKIMVMDEVKGRYVKMKKGRPPVKPVVVKKEVVKKPPAVEIKKEEKKVKPEPKPKPKPKKPKPTPKKVKPEEYPKVKAFITYLQNNKDTLGYEKLRKIVLEDSIQVIVYCSAAARDKLLVVIHKFDVEKYGVVKVVPDKYKVSTFFKRKVKPKTFLNKLRIGATLGFYKMSDTNFDEVYGSMTSFGFDISYLLSDNLDIWVYLGTSSKTSEIDWHEEDLKFKFTPLSLDLRYHFKKNPQWGFFAGVGLNIYPFEDTNPIEDVKDSATGFNVLGGAYYNITRNFSLQLILRYNTVKKEIENADNDLNMDSLEMLLGISVRF
ncbi:MAG: efflux RND transporter periplasmic adaptor subunit [Candidatus Aminicenantes bacterium]|nr:efflux RND transporter periplasmic adaptor subunit [Candidatus Aminicenantes bacterium]NIM82609.1 efflux RND transporter periplasmic adaptor subunit [Candidatus Aminicenantes bacterium]NIN21977.1 efflux RND transporter periplasmic adaptor subunit [Candidatus Aminicenantes bacterium]NIN45739.1 efflux RND transporter periplasmic adaptor subunit [Candidatus Aminicenantes bacterium]NIN88577.1 efflux RND transporter periplasmic adaptor subunit [Candidatus Aminicenantes bacterium]